MSRPLKFRAWTGATLEYNVMVGKFGAFYCAGIDPTDSACLSSANTIYGAETPIMQFTGLLDKNNKEIWEGDVIKVASKFLLGFQSNRTEPAPLKSVSFNNGSFVIMGVNEYVALSHVIRNQISGDSIEVIGNIYENPELLTK